MKRILFAYRFCNLGGVSSVIKQRLPALKAAGWSVTCLFERDDGGVSDLERAGVDEVRIAGQRLPGAFVEEAGRREYAALVIFDTPSVLAGAVRDGLPVCYEVHTSLERGLKGLDESDLLQARCVVVPSEWSRQWLLIRFPCLRSDQIKVSPNIVTPPQAIQDSFWRCGDGPLLWVGKLTAGKQWRELLRIADTVVEQRRDTEIFCVTGGHLEAARSAEFLAEAQALGLSDNLLWLHNMGHDSLMALYRSVAARQGVLLSTSRRESFCFAVHEAAWMGLPVVAARAGAVCNVIRDKANGHLYRPGDHQDAASKVLALMTNRSEHEALADEARVTVSSAWSPAVLSSDYVSLMSKLRPTTDLAATYELFDQVSADSPRISVVMTAYNASETISDAIGSVLAQTESSIELIVVDDASEDTTMDIVRQYTEKDDRVRLMNSRRNRGTYWAKNRGILASRGHYIALHDADDVSDPKRLKVQADAMDASPDKWLCYTNWERLNQAGDVVLNRGERARLGYPTALFRRGLITRIGFFDAVRVGGDHEFHRRTRAVMGASSVIHIKKTLYKAPLGYDSLTGRNPVAMELSDPDDAASYLSESRRSYIDAFSRWHNSGEVLFMPFPPRQRNVASPPAIRAKLFPPDYGLDISVVMQDSDEFRRDRMIRMLLPVADRICVRSETGEVPESWVEHPQVTVESQVRLSDRPMEPMIDVEKKRIRLSVPADPFNVLPLLKVLADLEPEDINPVSGKIEKFEIN